MVRSIFDNDSYKFTMGFAFFKNYPDAQGRWQLTIRDDVEFPTGFGEELRNKVRKMADLKASDFEIQRIKKMFPYFNATYIEFLKNYRYDPNEVGIIQNGGKLNVSVEAGYIFKRIYWEVPLMSTISELYFEMTGQTYYDDQKQKRINLEKASFLRMHNMSFTDFGTRRRYSYDVHNQVVKDMKSYDRGTFTGTSNVHLAMLNNTACSGTVAHEWYMFHGAIFGYEDANRLALTTWSKTFDDKLLIALPDTYTTDVFKRSFDFDLANKYDGVRQDSGDPIVFAKKLINHYKLLKIDPLTKIIIFSDALDLQKTEAIADFCKGKIKFAFGIGTFFTNDLGVKPLNMVIKMTACRLNPTLEWKNTIKLSDTPGKHMGELAEIENCKLTLNIK